MNWSGQIDCFLVVFLVLGGAWEHRDGNYRKSRSFLRCCLVTVFIPSIRICLVLIELIFENDGMFFLLLFLFSFSFTDTRFLFLLFLTLRVCVHDSVRCRHGGGKGNGKRVDDID